MNRFVSSAGKLLLAPLLSLLLLGGPTRHLIAQEQENLDRVNEALKRATDFLLTQQHDNGSYSNLDNYHRTTMSSLAIMAFASCGHMPSDDSREGRAARRALDYVLDASRQEEDGYFGRRDNGRMYGHGITTLMLSEMLGMGADQEQDELIRDRLTKAVQLILNSQQVRKDRNQQGGWRYEPHSTDSDVSVTVWQVMALRSAHSAGVEVPSEAIDEAVGYLLRTYTKVHDHGGFGYQHNQHPSYSTAAAGLLAMQVCGQYEAREVKATADYLLDQRLNPDGRWFFYGTYYYAQGMYQFGGQHAQLARERVVNTLLEHQEQNGSWEGLHRDERKYGPVYTTSLALLSMSVRNHFLPIYQR